MVKATRDEIEQYLMRMGTRGLNVLSTLGKLQPFVECMETEIGKVLLSDLINQHERLLEKISEVSATDEEKIEFKVVRRLLLDLAAKINQYNYRIGQIKKIANE